MFKDDEMTPIPDDLVQRAAEIVIAQQRATPSMLERLLNVHYQTAVALLEELERLGVVGAEIRKLGERAVVGVLNNNVRFLAVIDSEAKAVILGGIAKHYGISARAAYDEVTDKSAEHLLDYMVEPQRSAASVLMQAHGLRGY